MIRRPPRSTLLSLHDALPILRGYTREAGVRNLDREVATLCRKVAREIAEGRTEPATVDAAAVARHLGRPDRKSTRLNSSHANISYAVFCLKKKNNNSSSTTNT